MHPSPGTKYRPFPAVHLPDRRWPNRTLSTAPRWCSVDLRDGNQSLPDPMGVAQKLEFFDLLCRMGFKEIEIGFPSASDTEFTFCRRLIEEKHIPEGVRVQVLVQAREHLIRRTFEALRGAPAAIVHLYNSTNPLQRRVTFGLSKEEIRDIAVKGTQLVRELVPTLPGTDVHFQYSPESFSDTELEFSLEVCEAVMEAWGPTAERPLILNLPATVELATPNLHADQIEWFIRHLRHPERAIISMHTHNDRGTGTAATELGLLAGAQRVEGTLFGNGERTGNLDIVTVALNLYTQGIDPGLDLRDLPGLRASYERLTGMTVHDRHPYAGDLVFTAFSGSHQDAIKKGMDALDRSPGYRWEVPYLPIDPEDIGRTYKAIIRINSQSGKGGVAYVLEREYGFETPKKMHPELGQVIGRLADTTGRELATEEIFAAFRAEYLERLEPLILHAYEVTAPKADHHHVTCRAEVTFLGERLELVGSGNGPIAAFTAALREGGLKDFAVLDFRQHAISRGSGADAAAYLLIERQADRQTFWGVGVDTNIELAGLKALVSAYNRAHRDG